MSSDQIYGDETIEILQANSFANQNNLFEIYCGRPTILGNPFRVESFGRSKAIKLYEIIIRIKRETTLDSSMPAQLKIGLDLTTTTCLNTGLETRHEV